MECIESSHREYSLVISHREYSLVRGLEICA